METWRTAIVDACPDHIRVRGGRAARTRLRGLGHRVHVRTAPGVGVLLGLEEEPGLAGDGIRVVRALERAIAEGINPLPINIDGALAAILVDLGFPPLMGMLLFVIARVAGISAEVLEEHLREKPMRIRIPAEYDGGPPVDGGGS